MKFVVSQLMREAEPVPPMPVLEDERVDVDPLQIAGQECIDFEIVQDAVQRDDLQLEVKLDDLLDGDGQCTLVVKLHQELFSQLSDVVIGQNRWTKNHSRLGESSR